MSKRGVSRLFCILIVLSLFFIRICSAEFEVESSFLKTSITQGEYANRSLSVSSGTGDFMEISGDSPWMQISEKNIALNAGEIKNVNIVLNSSGLSPGIYLGSIKIMGGKSSVSIPVIFEVQSKDLFFGLNIDIPAQYTDVSPGGKMLAQIKIFDLTTSGGTSKGVGSSVIKMEYEVMDMQGRIIVSDSEDMVINGDTTTTKSISIPETLPKGDYLLSASCRYKSSSATSSRIFRIIETSSGNSWFQGGEFFSQPYFILLASLLFLAIILFLFSYFLRDRDKMLLELKKYNSWELNHQKSLLKEQAKILAGRGISKGEISREYRRKINHLRKKRKSRISEISKLQKSGSSYSEMRRKLNEWKREGYNTFNLEYKMKGLNEKDMKEMISKWKKEGYKGKNS